jgi:chitin disaccharide deacetylase
LKRLIINADDFGFTPDVNAGIVHAHREGVLTATTLMANGDAFDDAVRLSRENPTLDIGCHLVLVQGRSLVSGRPLPERPRDVALAVMQGGLDPYAELKPQVERIFDAGITPTHLDSHKHTHIVPRIFRAVVRLAHEYKIPYVRLPIDTALPLPVASRRLLRRYFERLASDYRVCMTDHFVGFRLTGSLSEATMAAALSNLREGTTELMCHPGFLREELQAARTRLKESRVKELEALTSARIKNLIEDQQIQLSSYRSVMLDTPPSRQAL